MALDNPPKVLSGSPWQQKKVSCRQLFGSPNTLETALSVVDTGMTPQMSHTSNLQDGILKVSVIIMIIIIIIIIVALKGAIRDFLQSPHCAVNCLQRVRSSGPGAIVCKAHAAHRALITCNMSCATWYEGTGQVLSFIR